MLIIYQDSPSSSPPPSPPHTPPPSLPGLSSLPAVTPSSSPTPLSCMIKKAEKEAHLFLENNRKLQNTKEALEAKRTHQIRILILLDHHELDNTGLGTGLWHKYGSGNGTGTGKIGTGEISRHDHWHDLHKLNDLRHGHFGAGHIGTHMGTGHIGTHMGTDHIGAGYVVTLAQGAGGSGTLA
ncbi:hypothetical protein Lal_00049348 [Lupinus albus]|nr:hypothetical protein Lal_00049348 [Lupinus albus]